MCHQWNFTEYDENKWVVVQIVLKSLTLEELTRNRQSMKILSYQASTYPNLNLRFDIHMSEKQCKYMHAVIYHLLLVLRTYGGTQ